MKAPFEIYTARKQACPAPGVGKGFHRKSFGVARAGTEAGIDQEVVFEDLQEIAERGSRCVPDGEIWGNDRERARTAQASAGTGRKAV